MSSSIFCQSTSDSNFLNPGGGSMCNSWRVFFFIFGSSLPNWSVSLPGFGLRFFVIFNRLFGEPPSWFPCWFLLSSFVVCAPMFDEERKALGAHSQLVTSRSRLEFDWNSKDPRQIKASRHVPKSCWYITLTSQSLLFLWSFCNMEWKKQIINPWHMQGHAVM